MAAPGRNHDDPNMRGERAGGRRSGDGNRGGEHDAVCPHCDDPIRSLTLTAASGPRAWPCGHRIPVADADRLTGAGPAVAPVGCGEN